MPNHPAQAALFLITALLAALPIAAQERRQVPESRTYGEPASAGDKAAIDVLVQEYKSTWERQDTAGLIALHSPDTEWINAYARMFQGAAPLAEFLEERLFPEFDPKVSKQEVANMRTISIRYLGDDAAVVHMYTESRRGQSRNEGEDVRRTHLHLVLAKQNDAWKVVHTAIMDAR